MELPRGFTPRNDDRNQWRSRLPFAGWMMLGVTVVIASSYLLYMPAQYQVEESYARFFARRAEVLSYDPESPAINVSQILYHANQRGYPYSFHEWFRNYGATAGFSNSLAEKYVMAPPGMRNASRIAEGEIFCLSAQPFRRGRLRYRTVVYRTAHNFWPETMLESSVAKMFEVAATPIPPPSDEPKPPRPPESARRYGANSFYLSAWLETRGQFSKLEWTGIAPATARLSERLIGVVTVAVLLLAISYCLWPVPVRARPDDGSDPVALLPTTTKAKVWWLAGATLLFLFLLGFAVPVISRDRGLATLYFHLLMPYLAAWEAMRMEARSGAAFLLLLQIVGYPIVAGYFWIRNRLGTAILALVILHLLALAFSVAVAADQRWRGL